MLTTNIPNNNYTPNLLYNMYLCCLRGKNILYDILSFTLTVVSIHQF